LLKVEKYSNLKGGIVEMAKPVVGQGKLVAPEQTNKIGAKTNIYMYNK
jgi:hypothetical protein